MFLCFYCLSLKINELIFFHENNRIFIEKYFFLSNKRIIFALFLKTINNKSK